jgi:hypothetical protein
MFSDGTKTNRAHKPWKCRIMAAVDALAVLELTGVDAVRYRKAPTHGVVAALSHLDAV